MESVSSIKMTTHVELLFQRFVPFNKQTHLDLTSCLAKSSEQETLNPFSAGSEFKNHLRKDPKSKSQDVGM